MEGMKTKKNKKWSAPYHNIIRWIVKNTASPFSKLVVVVVVQKQLASQNPLTLCDDDINGIAINMMRW